MRAVLARASDVPIEVEDVRLRDLQPGELLVRLDAAAICTTDANSVLGMSPSPRPFVPGHSATGVVVAAGAGATKAMVGDRIITAGTMECGECYACVRGTPSQCDRLWEWLDDPFVVGEATSDGRPIVADGGVGTLAEHMIYRERCLAVVNSDLPVDQLALMGCGGISGVGAVLEVGKVQPGDTVAVIGCGHLGLWMIQAARLVGAARIIAVEPIAERRGLAERAGATDLLDPTAEGAAEGVLRLTSGRGVDVGLEACGVTSGMTDVFDATRKGGVVVLTSMSATAMTDVASFAAFPLAIFGKQIRSSQSGGGFIGRDLARFTAFAEAGRLDPAMMVSRTYPLADAPVAMRAALAREIVSGVVLNQR